VPTVSPAVNLLSSDLLLALRVGDGNPVTNAASCPSYTQTCITNCGCNRFLGICPCGDVTTCTPNSNGCRTHLDVLNTAGARVATYPVALPDGVRCHLFWGASERTREGALARSDDNRFVSFTCYNGVVGAATQKVVVRVGSDLAMSYTTYNGIYTGNAFSLRGAVLEAGGARAYVAGASGSNCNDASGVYTLPFVPGSAQTPADVASSRGLCGDATRAVGTFSGDVYATFADTGAAGLYRIGSGYVTEDFGYATLLPGFENFQVANGQPWGFVFESNERLWLADSSNPAAAHVFGWTLGAPDVLGTRRWARSVTVNLGVTAPVYSLAGRAEFIDSASVFMLYALVQPDAAASTLWRYNTATRAYAQIASLGTNQRWSGVAFPPAFPSASASGTPTSSQTPSNTSTSTSSPSQTGTSTPSSSETSTGTPSPSQTASGTGTGTGTPTQTMTPTQTATTSVTPTNTETPSPSGTAAATGTSSPSQTPSNTETGTSSATIGATPSITASGSETSSMTPSGTVTATASRSATASVSLSAAATQSATMSESLSSSATPSTSVSGSTTPSPSETATVSGVVNRYTFSNIMVHRVGDGTCAPTSQSCTTTCNCARILGQCFCGETTSCVTNPTNAGCPTFLDEMTPGGAVVSSTRLTVAGGNCNLWWGTADFNKEGFATTSGDGRYVNVPCYDSSATVGRAAARRTLVRMGAQGLSTATFFPASVGTLVSAHSADGSSHFVSVSAGAGCGQGSGLKSYVWGGAATLTPVTTNAGVCTGDARSVAVVAGQLYASFDETDFAGVYRVGTGVPITEGTAATLLPGFADEQARLPSPWSFAIDALGSGAVWLADDRSTAVAHVYRYQRAPVTQLFAVTRAVRFGTADPVYSLAGRSEGVGAARDWVLYAVSQATGASSQVWRYSEAANAAVAIATVAGNRQARSVLFPPAWPSATPSRTPTSSITPSRTPSHTMTSSRTASASETASITASSSETASITSTPSITASSSATASLTASSSPSASVTPSNSPTPSGSPPSTPSSSETPPGTPSGSASPSASITSSQTPTGTASASQTPSNTPSASTTGTASITATPPGTPSFTRTAAGTFSRTRTIDPTTSRTRTPDGSPSAGATTSRTAAPSASTTGTGTPSSSGSRSPSVAETPTRSGTPEPTGTSSASVSATATETSSASTTETSTSSVSATATSTSSPSSSETSTSSVSATATETASVSVTASETAAVTPSVTAAETPSRTAPATSSGTAASTGTPTKTRVPLPSATRTKTATKTRTSTATRTRTKTKTKTKTPSKKKKLVL